VPVNALSLEPTSRSVGLQRTLGLEEAHASPCGYVPRVGLRRSP